MSSNVKSVTLRIHTLPDRAAPGPPRPSPFLARPETLRAGSVVRGSWAVTRKPVGPSRASQRLSAGKRAVRPPPHLRGRSPRFLAQGRESLAERGRQVLSDPARPPSGSRPGAPARNTLNNNTQAPRGRPGRGQQHGTAWPGRRAKLSERWIYVLWPRQTQERLPATLTEHPAPRSLLPAREERGGTSRALAAERVTRGGRVLFLLFAQSRLKEGIVWHRGGSVRRRPCAGSSLRPCFPRRPVLQEARMASSPGSPPRFQRTSQLPVLGVPAAAGDRCEETVVHEPPGGLGS